MPEPEEPTPPAPLKITARIEVELEVEVDVAGLVFQNRLKPNGYISSETDQPMDYDALTPEWLRKNGYGLDEKASVFIWNQINDTLTVDCYTGDDLIKETPLWNTTEIKFKWTPELQAELDARFGEVTDGLPPEDAAAG